MSDFDPSRGKGRTGPEPEEPIDGAESGKGEGRGDPLADLIADLPLGRDEGMPKEFSSTSSASGRLGAGLRGSGDRDAASGQGGGEEPSASNLLKALSKAGVVPVGLIPLTPDVIPQARLIREIRQIQPPSQEPEEPPAKAPEAALVKPAAPAPVERQEPALRAETPPQPSHSMPAPTLERPSLPLISNGDEGPQLFMAEPNRYFSIREGLRGAKAKLAVLRKEHGHRIFLFTGSDSGVGVSTVTFNLALLMALEMADNKILVIDANLSSPSLHQAFGCSPDPGLLNFLTEPLELDRVLVDSGMPNLHLITCGHTTREVYSPFDLARMDLLLKAAGHYYDYVLIDTAPALRASDTRILARKADGVVITVRYNQTKNQVGQELIRQLSSDGARIVGSVLNRRQFVIPKFFYRFT